jgi:hypothetical protein
MEYFEAAPSDDRAIFTAASKASQAADYLRSFSEKLEAEAAYPRKGLFIYARRTSPFSLPAPKASAPVGRMRE